MSKKKKKKKIIKYSTGLNINLTVITFVLVILYILYIIYSSVTAVHVSSYEVMQGSLAVNNTYRGVIMRSEEVFQAKETGYINYYAREGERVKNGAMVYTIDESGKLGNIISSQYDTAGNLTNQDLEELKTDIMNYRNSYSDFSYDSVYDFKYSAMGTVQKLANKNVLTSLSQITDKSVLDLVKFDHTTESGILVYNIDGLEELTTENISEDIFDENKYAKKQMQSNAIVENGEPVYKLITDENWSVIIPIDDNIIAPETATEDEKKYKLANNDYVKVKFTKIGEESWGKINIIKKDKQSYCKLDFTNSMISFATDRYIDVELQLSNIQGLKVPNSALIYREFYKIDSKFIMDETDKDQIKFLRKTYNENSEQANEEVYAKVYNEEEIVDEETGDVIRYVYIDNTVFNEGDELIQNQGADVFKCEKGNRVFLTGVYNINKGYTDFTLVKILDQNDEYAIVTSNTQYGLAVYDHIVLDGASVNENDYIFE